MLTPVEKSSLADEVAKKLRMEILTGNIKPGERLREQAISERMKTSHGPVRDALIRLEHEGLIRREPNRSATVVSMTAEDVEEVHSLRLALELLALRYVMERARPADVSRLQGAVASLRACLRGNYSLQEAVDLDLRFHEELMITARNGRLLSIWQGIKPQIWFLIYSRSAYAMKNFQQAISTHEDLLDAVRARDYRKGKAIIKAHLDTAYASLIATYRKAHRRRGDEGESPSG